MEVKQIYEIANDVTKQLIGVDTLMTIDGQNVVDAGKQLYDSSVDSDKITQALVNRIGKTIFVNRPYKGSLPSIYMDGWEYGSVMMKISQDELPEATENESWTPTKGASYDPNVFYGVNASSKFYNKMTTFEVPLSILDEQMKQSFASLEQLNAFWSMIQTNIQNSMELKREGLVLTTLGSMMGETIFKDFGDSSTSSGSGTRAVNLLYLYNQTHQGATLTTSNCMESPDFLRFCAMKMGLGIKHIQHMSKLFNIEEVPRHTPSDMLHFVMLADFASAADVYLQSGTFHEEYTKLPKAEIVSYWQGSGQTFGFDSVSKIHLTTAAGHEVEQGGILAVMFDHWALGINGMNRRVTRNYNGKAEFTNMWFKEDTRYFNDYKENCVVYFIA